MGHYYYYLFQYIYGHKSCMVGGGVPRHALIGSDYICDRPPEWRETERELVCVRVFLYINKYIALKKNFYARPFLFHKKHIS